VLLEDLEVSPNGHVRDAEVAGQIGHADRARLANAIEDEGLTLAREHRLASRFLPRRAAAPDGAG
jgi:hypothetical protein